MSNPLRHPEVINPQIAVDVQAAYEKNLAAGRVVDSGFAGDVASAGLADIVRAETAAAKEAGDLAGSGLDQISSPEIKRNFETAFAETERLFGRVILDAPSVEQFTAARVDFVNLEKEYKRMEQAELKPTLVISPVLPLTKEASSYLIKDWQHIYDFLTADTTIPNNPLKKQTDGNGLYIAENVRYNAKDLFQQEMKRINDNPDINQAYVPTNDNSDLAWTVALLPTTDKPQELQTAHTLHENTNDPTHSELATISQYLTLQATSIQAGLSPVDKDTYSWLQGTFNDGARAPCGFWDSGYGRVRVNWDGVGSQRDDMGVRLPVWG